MSKRLEGQEVEAFSSLGNLAMQEHPFAVSSFSMVGGEASLAVGSSARFLENPHKSNHPSASSSSSSSSNKQKLNSSSSKHGHLQIVSSVAPLHQASHSHTSAASSHQAISHTAASQIQACSNHDTNGNSSSLVASDHQHLRSELNPILELGGRRTTPKPLSVVTGIFNCWNKNKEKSGSFQHTLSRQPLDKLSAPVLAEQTRLQKVALVETQDTRDMWEWQMEQQQAITSQEHNLLERTTMENPLMKVMPDLMRRNSSANRSTNSAVSMLGQLARTTSNGSCEQSKDGAGRDTAGDEQKALAEGHSTSAQEGEASASGGVTNASLARSDESPTWNVYSHIWQDGDAVSAMTLLFESALLRCRAEVAYFCRVYMQQMVLSGYALIRTLMEMQPNTVFARKVHASYALEGHVHMVMFRCFESDSFDKSGVTHILDPVARAAARAEEYARMKGVDAEEALRAGGQAYKESFHAYCAAKSEEVMQMFPWMNMGYRNAAERDRFMEAFLRAAKWVWLLHRLANCTHPPVHILRVGHGHIIDPVYVESVCVPSIGTCPKCPAAAPPKVEFMIMPGFVSPSRKIFRCQVYQHYMCKPTSS